MNFRQINGLNTCDFKPEICINWLLTGKANWTSWWILPLQMPESEIRPSREIEKLESIGSLISAETSTPHSTRIMAQSDFFQESHSDWSCTPRQCLIGPSQGYSLISRYKSQALLRWARNNSGQKKTGNWGHLSISIATKQNFWFCCANNIPKA